METGTLFVVSSRRSLYVLSDLISAIRWSAQGAYRILVVDEVAALISGDHEVVTLTTGLPSSAASGFHQLSGLGWALEHELQFGRAILLDDTCLLTGRGLDTWLASCFKDERIGLLGVQDQGDFQRAYQRALSLLDLWEVPHTRWEQPPTVLAPHVLGLTRAAANALYERGLLVPSECPDWPTHYGAFVSWACQMLGFLQVSWGYVTKPLPPLYVYSGGAGGPAPHLLSDRFALYAPAGQALAYSEGDLREMYKQLRGEPARQVPVFSPVVSAPLS